MKTKETQDLLLKAAGLYGKDIVQVFVGSVVSVNEDERTCTVETVSAEASFEMPDVKLTGSNNDGMILIPQVDSTVLVATTDRSGAYILMTSDIDKCLVIIDDQNFFEFDSTSFRFNGGENEGLMKISQTVSKLNALENDLNTIKAAILGWAPVAGDGGTALKAALAAWYGQLFVPTTQAELENTKVKH